MAMATITIEIDENLKAQAEKVFADKGLDMASAFRIFVKQVVKEQKISDGTFAAMGWGESNLKATEKAETVKAESYAEEYPNIGVEEMIDLGGSRRYSTGLRMI